MLDRWLSKIPGRQAISAALLAVAAAAALTVQAGILTIGGGRTGVAVPTPSSGGYSTTCSATENPLDEGGTWLGGAQNSGIFANMRSSSGRCYADRVITGANEYTDSLAILTPANYTTPADQYAQVTLYDAGGTSPGSHEVEILLRASSSFALYEVLIPRGGTNVQIVHQNGSKPGFTVLSQTGGGWGSAFASGDVVRAEVTTTAGDVVITVYKNSVLGATATITNATYKILSGNCGIGAYVQDGTGVDPIAFSVDSFTCGGL